MKNTHIILSSFICFFIMCNVALIAQPNAVKLTLPSNSVVFYPSITAAYAAIPTPPTGNYLIEIQSNYNGTDVSEVYPIQLGNKGLLPGGYTITIRPDINNFTAVFKRPVAAAGVVLQINGGDNIVIDGRPGSLTSSPGNYLTISDTYVGGSLNRNIELLNGANNNIVKYVNSSAAFAIPNEGSRNILVGGGSAANNNDTISNCIISGGYRVVSVGGASASIYNTGTVIQNNLITDFGYHGVFLNIYQNNTIVQNNTLSFESNGTPQSGFRPIIEQTGLGGTTDIVDNTITVGITSLATISSITAIAINGSGGGTKNILKNRITRINAPGSGIVNGIFVLTSGIININENIISNISGNSITDISGIGGAGTSGSPATIKISKNKIFNLSSSISSTIDGVYLDPDAGSDIDISNNFISIMQPNSNNTLITGISCYSSNTNSNIIYSLSFNSIRIGGLHTGGNSGQIVSAGIYREDNGTGAIYKQKNNIVINERSGGNAGVIHAGFYNNNTVGTLSVDYNTYFGTNSNQAVRWLSNTYTNNDLANYKTAVSPQEQHSGFTNINFVSNTDLHLTAFSFSDSSLLGIPVIGITKDIDDSTRSADRPTQGADEGNALFFCQLCSGGNSAITSNIVGASYQWQVNTGSGFTNISDNSNYNGTNTNTLQFISIPSFWYGYQYRCIVNTGVSNVITLHFVNIWNGSVGTSWENPLNWSCGMLPDYNTDVVIHKGSVIVNSNAICRTLTTGTSVTFTVAGSNSITVYK